MAWVATAIIGAGALGAGASIYGSTVQAGAQQSAANTLLQGQNSALRTLQKYLGPYAQAGQDILPTLKSLITPGPNQTATLSQTPGFQFAQNWGLKGVQNVQSTRGLGGNALAAGSEFSTGLAQNTWMDTVRNLMQLYQSGQGAAGNIASGASNVFQSFAPSIAGTQVGAANAIAGGATGAAGAVGGAASNFALYNALTGGMYGGVPSNPAAYNASPWSLQTGPMNEQGLVNP